METAFFENTFKLPFAEAKKFEETLVTVTAKLLALRESDEFPIVCKTDDAYPDVSISADDDDSRIFNVTIDDSLYSVTRTWAARIGIDGNRQDDLLNVREGELSEKNEIIDPGESKYQQVIKAIAHALESVEILDAEADTERSEPADKTQGFLRRLLGRLFS